jgi:hypothetical protein
VSTPLDGFERVFPDTIDMWARHQWLMPVILATQEAEIRRTVV